MKDCTGELYAGQGQSIRAAFGDKWHGKYGHLNVLERDHDSVVTGKGAHDRVVVFMPEGNSLECRVDHVWNLGMPTPAQVLAVARAWPNEVKGKWVFDRKEQWRCGKSTDFHFKRS